MRWIKRKLRAAHTSTLLWLFLGWGTKLFGYVREQHNKHGRTTAMFFAQDEREMNIAARSYVESLDKGDTNETN